MSRGGVRPGSGRKPKWKHGKTKAIRVPEELADEIMSLAEELDSNGFTDLNAKIIDLSGIPLFESGENVVVFLHDLFLKGYEIRPSDLAARIALEVYKKQVSEGYSEDVVENQSNIAGFERF